MLPELTEFVPTIIMGIVRKVFLGLENRAGCIFSLLLNAFEWSRKKIYYFVELLLLDIALFEYAPHSIVNVNKQLKRGSTRVFFYFDKTTEQVTI
jgi:hypothetical protein